MKNYEYNWATAEMMIMYLWNSRAQEKRKALKATEVSNATTPDSSTTDTGLTAANHGDAGGSSSDDLDSDSDSDDNE